MHPATRPGDMPEDLRFAQDFAPVPLAEQIDIARAEVHRYRERNEHRITRPRGHGAMAPLTYAIGIHRRRSILYTLLALQRAQRISGDPQS